MSKWIRKSNIDEIAKSLMEDERQLLVCIDAQVERLYASELADLKGRHNLLWFSFGQGENAKNFAEWERALEFFIDRGVSRKSHLIAIGGGALSDAAGFVAATLLRGITWSIVPTTILSQVDASIGGKVAINAKHGKNLVGSFHQPNEIFVCEDFLSSLSKEEIISGKGEIAKYAFLDLKIAQAIEAQESLSHIIDLCAVYKLELVKRDFKESGERKILNLGHTFGHAVEWSYSIPHGEAVIWGLALIFILDDQSQQLEKLKKVLENLQVRDIKTPWNKSSWDLDRMIAIVKKDKKSIDSESVELIVVNSQDQVVIEERKWSNISNALTRKQGDIHALSLN
ncbi:MAG: hypothetical protein CME71_01085 [Halobacteriovorax sp.]|nr:hypothetical protein [Halobacteriovorax sp.]|tara:strand:+ start:467 stop:1489 length:1023 start_codon:yes stop_codon:yes gene_type:complete